MLEDCTILTREGTMALGCGTNCIGSSYELERVVMCVKLSGYEEALEKVDGIKSEQYEIDPKLDDNKTLTLPNGRTASGWC